MSMITDLFCLSSSDDNRLELKIFAESVYISSVITSNLFSVIAIIITKPEGLK